MTAARIIPITQGADRDLVILSALKAAHSFISNPARVEYAGDLCTAEYLYTQDVYARTDKLIRQAIMQLGEVP